MTAGGAPRGAVDGYEVRVERAAGWIGESVGGRVRRRRSFSENGGL